MFLNIYFDDDNEKVTNIWEWRIITGSKYCFRWFYIVNENLVLYIIIYYFINNKKVD